MERIFAKKNLGFKIIATIVIVNFILTSAPIGAYARAIDSEQLRTRVAKDGGTTAELAKDFIRMDGGAPVAASFVKFLAENVIVGDEKGKDVGRVIRLAKLLEEKLNGAILGHSATRQAFIEEMSREIEKALIEGLINDYREEARGEAIKKAEREVRRMWRERGWIEGATMYTKIDEESGKIEERLILAYEEKVRKGDEVKELALRRARARFNEIINHRLIALLNAGVKDVTLCVGGSEEEILEQLKGYFNGISKEQLLKGTKIYIAYEPPELIGKIAEVKDKKADVAADTERVRKIHQSIYDWLEAKYETSTAKLIDILYGASVSGENIGRIMEVKSTRPGMEGYPLVHGVLFASTGKTVDGFLAVAQGVDKEAKRDRRKYAVIVNLKEFKREEKTPADKYINEIYRAIIEGKIDPSRTVLAIADQDTHLKEWQEALAKIEADYSRIAVAFEALSLGKAVIQDIEKIGAGYTKVILAPETKIAKERSLKKKLEEHFKEKTRDGDVYLFIKKDNKYNALAKENKKDQTLMTIPMADLVTDQKARDDYYASLLEYVSLVTTKTRKGLELVPITGDELKLKSFLIRKGPEAKARANSPNTVEESVVLGNLVGTKRWQGDGILEEPFFQFEYNVASAKEGVRPTLLTFKRSDNPQTRGWSAIIQPKYTHLTVGFGTEGSQIAKNSRLLGYNVIVSNRSGNERAAFAQSLGIPLFLLNPEDKKEFDKAGIKTEGTLKDLLDFLESKNEIFLITDATDGETTDPETGKTITVAEYNKKYIYSKYKNARVMYEGGEDPEIADEFFDVGTLNVLGISYAEKMVKIKPVVKDLVKLKEGMEKIKLQLQELDKLPVEARKGLITNEQYEELKKSFEEIQNEIKSAESKGEIFARKEEEEVKSLFFPSCNTTGYGLVLDRVAFNSQDLDVIGEAIRRIHDPFPQKGKEPIDSIKIDSKYHHAKDYSVGREKYPLLYNAFKKQPSGEPSIFTGATTGPQTKYHVIPIWITGLDKSGKPLTANSVKRFLSDEPRLALVEFKKDVFNLASIGDLLQTKMELMQSYIPIIQVLDFGTGRVQVNMAVPQESIVIPNNMNGIHALSGLYEREASVRLVNDIMKLSKISRKTESSKPFKSARAKVTKPTPLEYLTMDDIDWPGKTVLVRGDGNSTVIEVMDEEGKKVKVIKSTDKIADDAKMLKILSGLGAKVIYLTHQGRPGDPDFIPTDQHAKIISDLIGKPVKHVDDLFGEKAISSIEAMKNGDIIVLMNARAWPGEVLKLSADEHARSEVIQKLRPHIDIVMYSKLSILHRSQLTVVGWAGEAAGSIPIIFGPLVIGEIEVLDRAAEKIEKLKPSIGVLGGSKIDDYLGLMEKYLKNGVWDRILSDGLLGNAFLMALGYNLGKPSEDVLAEQVKDYKNKKYEGKGVPVLLKVLQDLYQKYPNKIIIPKDVAFINAAGERIEVAIIEEKHRDKESVIGEKNKAEPISADFVIEDIGTITANLYAEEIRKAKVVFAKGPMGNFKKEQMLKGSEIVLKEGIAKSEAYKFSGGGDLGALTKMWGVKFDDAAQSGGASIEYLEKGEDLAGLLAQERSTQNIRKLAEALGVDKKTLLNYLTSDSAGFRAQAGIPLKELIAKVDNMIKEGRLLDESMRALIVTPNAFRKAAAKQTLTELIQLSKVYKIALYGDGDKAEKLKTLIGDEGIVTAKDLGSLLDKLEQNFGIKPENIALLRTDKEETIDEAIVERLQKEKIKQIDTGDLITLAVAKVTQTLFDNEETQKLFAEFYEKMAEKEVISAQTYAETKDAILAKLQEGMPFKFPDIKVTDTVSQQIDAAKKVSEEFMDNI